jgi:hypothetical protein
VTHPTRPTEQAKLDAQNGERFVANIGAQQVIRYQLAERESVHLLLIQDALHSLVDVTVGKVKDARDALSIIKRSRNDPKQ